MSKDHLIKTMGRKKKSDAHLQRRITLRLPAPLMEQLDALVKSRASELNHEIRNAIRRCLEAEGFWPPPTGAD
jgi:hypothetical protein